MARIGQTSFRTTRYRHRPTMRPSGCKGSKARIPSGSGEMNLQYEAGYMTAVLLQSKCHPRSYLLASTGGSIYDSHPEPKAKDLIRGPEFGVHTTKPDLAKSRGHFLRTLISEVLREFHSQPFAMAQNELFIVFNRLLSDPV